MCNFVSGDTWWYCAWLSDLVDSKNMPETIPLNQSDDRPQWGSISSIHLWSSTLLGSKTQGAGFGFGNVRLGTFGTGQSMQVVLEWLAIHVPTLACCKVGVRHPHVMPSPAWRFLDPPSMAFYRGVPLRIIYTLQETHLSFTARLRNAFWASFFHWFGRDSQEQSWCHHVIFAPLKLEG